MKAKIAITLVLLVLFVFVNLALAQERDGYVYSVDDLKRRMDLFSNRRVEIGVMLNDTDSLMLVYKLPGQKSGDAVLNMVHMLDREELQKRIGQSVLDYCLEFGVDPDSEKAINFGNALYEKLLYTDKINRKVYRDLYKEAQLKEEQLRQRVLDRQQESSQKESVRKEKVKPGMVEPEYDITGVWKTDRYGDVVEFKRVKPNLWNGYLVTVRSEKRKKWGYKPGVMVYKNIVFVKGNRIYGQYITIYPDNGERKWGGFNAEYKNGKIKMIGTRDGFSRHQ